VCATDNSVELVELEDREKGLWVSRDEVHKATQDPGQLAASAEQ